MITLGDEIFSILVATNAVVNTGAGNIADNKIGKTGTIKSDAFKGAVPGAIKMAEEILKDD